MPKMKSPSDRKPPLAESVSRLSSRSILRSKTIHTSPVTSIKTQLPKRSISLQEPELRPESHSLSCEFQALEKMIKDEIRENYDMGNPNFGNCCSVTPLERGRFYDEYSARRNDRLKKRKCEIEKEKKTVYNSLGVNIQSVKKTRVSKNLESLRKSVPDNFTVTRSENTRYSLRSSTKENKKPLLVTNSDKSVNDGERSRVGTSRARQI